MAIQVAGLSGELRAGGRTAAVLGEWEAERTAGQWIGHAVLASTTIWFGAAERYELRLNKGSQVLRWKEAEIIGDVSVRFTAFGNPARN